MKTPVPVQSRRLRGSCSIVVSALLIAMISIAQDALPAEITSAKVSNEDDKYLIRFSANANVSTGVLLGVLRDYQQYKELSPVIVEAEVLRPEETGLRLRLLLRPCVLGFCRNLRKVTDVAWLTHTSVEYRGVPGRGSFKSSRETITVGAVAGDAGSATFNYDAELVPGFFIPPVIGTWLISRQIRAELLATLEGVEASQR